MGIGNFSNIKFWIDFVQLGTWNVSISSKMVVCLVFKCCWKIFYTVGVSIAIWKKALTIFLPHHCTKIFCTYIWILVIFPIKNFRGRIRCEIFFSKTRVFSYSPRYIKIIVTICYLPPSPPTKASHWFLEWYGFLELYFN